MLRILARVIPEITCKISKIHDGMCRSHLAAVPDAVWTFIFVENLACSLESKDVRMSVLR
jgi:hypothetical protein